MEGKILFKIHHMGAVYNPARRLVLLQIQPRFALKQGLCGLDDYFIKSVPDISLNCLGNKCEK